MSIIVKDAITGQLLPGASIDFKVSTTDFKGQTAANGAFNFSSTVPTLTGILTVELANYTTSTGSATLNANQDYTVLLQPVGQIPPPPPPIHGSHVGLFLSTFGAPVTNFYHATFGQGVFDSLELWTPYGCSYSNTQADTKFIDELKTIHQLAQAEGRIIYIFLIVTQNLDPVTGAQEYNQLQSMLDAIAASPEFVGVGINWERSLWGGDNFKNNGIRAALASGVTPATMNAAFEAFRQRVLRAGKSFVNYYGPPVSSLGPASGVTWEQIFNAGYPSNYANAAGGNGYWTVAWDTAPIKASTGGTLDTIGVSCAVFQWYGFPAPLTFSDRTGKAIPPAPLQDYNGNVGPVGQWNTTTVDWLLQNEALLISRLGSSASRQFIFLGGTSISDPPGSQFGKFSGAVIDSSLPNSGGLEQLWNSADFQNWVKASKAKYGF